MRIMWKLIGDRLGGIYGRIKMFSTILPGPASATLSTTMLDQWRLPAAYLTSWMNSLIQPRPRKLHMSKTRSHSSSNSSSSNSSRNSLRTCLPKVANEATGHLSLSQPTPLAAANPANRDQTYTASQVVGDNRQVYRQYHGSQRQSSKADILPTNAYNADLETTRQDSSLNTHEEVTHHSRTSHLLQTGTEDTKSNDRSPSIINSQKTHRLLSASGPMGEVRQGGIGVRVVGNADFDGNDGQHTTTSDRFEGKGVVGDPKSSHVKSVLMRHFQTGHVPYYSRSFYKR